MRTRYVKRFRMEIDFRQQRPPRATLPDGFAWRAWEPSQLAAHAEVKAASFRAEFDSRMFHSLASYAGCEELMRSIVQHPGFLPQATWLIDVAANEFRDAQPCGTIQGIVHSSTLGSIQNVGIIPEFRSLGLGRALVLKALAGFRQYGILRVYLDVTAENLPAVELYRSIGFACRSTSYREIPEPAETA